MEPQGETKEQLLEKLETLESRFSEVKKALGESEQKFRLLYENAPLGYQSLDANGCFLEVNPAWLDLLGYDREEVIGRWCGDFLTQQCREKFVTNFPKFKAAGEIHGIEFEMKKKDGSTVLVEVDGKISRDQRGNFRQTHCVLHDVTSLGRTQAESRESENRYRDLFENAPVAICEQDLSDLKAHFDELKAAGVHDFRLHFETHPGEVALCASLVRILDINRECVAYFQVPAKENVPRDLTTYFNEESWEVFREHLVRLAEGQTSFAAETVIRDLQGQRRIVSATWSVLKGTEQTLKRVLLSFVDVTEGRRAEQALAASNRQWQLTFEAVSDLIMVVDNHHRIFRANRAMAAALGMTEQDLIGKPCFELVHGEKEPPGFCPHSQLLSDGEEHSVEVVEPRLAATLDVRVSPLVDESGRVVGSVHVARDITERKREENVRFARLRLMEFADAHTLEELLQATLDEAEALTGSLIGFYHFVDTDQRTLRLQSWSTRTLSEMCTAEGKGLHYDINEAGVWVDCVHERKPVIHNDYSALPHRRGMPPGHAKVTRELVVPVSRGNRIVAILGVGNKPVDYAHTDVEIVSLLADLAWDIAERKLADENLRSSEAKFVDLYENAPCAYFSVGTDAIIRLCNRRAGELLGYSREELIGKPVLELYSDRPEGKEKAEDTFKRFLAGESIADEELRMQKADGSAVWISLTVNGVRDSDGRLVESRSMVMDISDRKRAEEEQRRLTRELRAISNCNQTLLRAVDEQTLVEDVCRIVCDEAGYRLAWVGYAENDVAKTVRPAAWAGFDNGYVANAGLTWEDVTERGQGPAGKAIRTGETVYVQDIANDPQMGPWRESSLQRGYRSVLTLPLKEESANAFGVLLIYHAESNAITPDEIQLMEELAGDLAYGIVALRTRAERKRAEESLSEKSQFIDSLLRAAPVAIFYKDREGRYIGCNDAFTQIMGFSYDEIRGKTVHELWPSELADKYHQMDLDLMRNRQHQEYEFAVKGKDAEIHPVIFAKDVYLDSHGEVAGLVGAFLDITELKKTERELQRSNDLLRAIIDAAPTAIIGLDLDGNVRGVWNRAAEKMLGWSAQEVMGRPLPSVPVEGRDEFRGFRERIRIGKTLDGVEVRRQRKDGSLIDYSIYASPLHDDQGQIKGNIAVMVDISERKRADEHLRRLFTAVESAGETIMVTDSEGAIIYVNPTFEETTGYSAQEALGKTPRILKSGKHDNTFYREMWDTLLAGQVWRGRLINKKKDSTIYEETATISPIKDASGRIVNYVAVKRDVTGEAILQRQLLLAQKMEAIGTLAGGIAHDFNNLLQAILGYSDLLLISKAPGDPDCKKLEVIQHAARDGAELVGRILTFSRKAESKVRPADLNQEILKAEPLLRRTLPRMIGIKLVLAENLWIIDADPAQIEQVVLNLGVNAQHAMPDGGQLLIETRNISLSDEHLRTHLGAKPGKYVVLTVSDTGVGMEPEVLDRIFEPFFTTKADGEGTGLGLAMVHGIVTQHGGYVRCYSEPGVGTSFKMYFPVSASERISDSAPTREMPAFGTETILLVDDDDAVEAMGRQMIGMGGYKVLTARSGEEALEKYKAFRDEIALVIMDLIMPGMGGKRCLEQLLTVDPNVKVLVASGYSADTISHDLKESGAKGFINKPYDAKDILGAIRQVLDQGQL